MIRLLIADDHPVVRAGLKGTVAQQPDMRIVAECRRRIQPQAKVSG